MGTPKYGGRLPGQTRQTPVVVTGDTGIFKSAEPAPAPVAPAPEVHHQKVRVKRGSKYSTPGLCKITGEYRALDSEGISSKGRQRINGKIKYQKTKVILKMFPEYRRIVDEAFNQGAWDSGLQGLLFGNNTHVENTRAALEGMLANASVYTPSVKKVKVP